MMNAVAAPRTVIVDGRSVATDAEGYLLDRDDWSEAFARALAREEGLTLTPAHWEVIRFLRDKYREDGQTPNFRNMLKEFAEEIRPGTDSKYLYDLFPGAGGPAKQAAKVAGLPKPFGKGGY